MTTRAWACAAAAIMAGCVGTAELPAVHGQQVYDPCDMGYPPWAEVTETGDDPVVCLPSDAKGSVHLSVTVSKSGEAVAVHQVYSLCLEFDTDGTILTTHVLTPAEKACALRELRGWRFLGVDSCHEVQALVTLRPCDSCGAVQQHNAPAEVRKEDGH